MKMYLASFLCSQILLFYGQTAYAEDYTECKARCAQFYTDCVNQPQATDPEVQTAKELSCDQKSELCNSDCENLKPVTDGIEPNTNPNIIIK